MAMATTDHKADPPAQQRTTPGIGAPTGIGMMGAPVVPVAAPLEPTLPPDIDPVLLVRLYPGANTAAELHTQAMAAGKAVQEQGEAMTTAMAEGATAEVPAAPPPHVTPPQPAPHK